MSLPKVIHIGCIDYTTHEKEDLIDHNSEGVRVQLNGHILSDSTEIRLEIKNSPSRKRCTVFHEIIHGVLFNASVDDLEHKMDETMIDILAHGLLDALRSNPDLVAYFMEKENVE